MRLKIIILLCLFPVFVNSQSVNPSDSFTSNLTISKYVDRHDTINQVIIRTLDDFLASKDSALFKSRFWIDSDFEKYKFPFIDLFRIEYDNETPNAYHANLLEVIELEKEKVYLVKVAFVSSDSKEKSHLKSIYNLIATYESGKVLFSRSLNYFIEDWKRIDKYPVTYVISPNRSVNQKEIEQQLADIELLNEYFETDSIELTYYSCVTPVELFQIKGFDYVHQMYQNKKGGLVEFGNHVFSGNASEYYTHEIVHIYVNNKFPGANSLLNEGIAMYFGGSGGKAYDWHKNQLAQYIENQKDFSFINYMDAFDQKYVDNQTSIPYMTGALIYEYVVDKYDKYTYFNMLKDRKDPWEILKPVGLTDENINEMLMKTLNK